MSRKLAPFIRDFADLFQRDVKGLFNDLGLKDILQGVLITDVDLTTTTTKVPHKLGRVPKGWIVVDRTADSRVYRDSSVTRELKTYLNLKATTDCSVSIWVF